MFRPTKAVKALGAWPCGTGVSLQPWERKACSVLDIRWRSECRDWPHSLSYASTINSHAFACTFVRMRGCRRTGAQDRWKDDGDRREAAASHFCHREGVWLLVVCVCTWRMAEFHPPSRRASTHRHFAPLRDMLVCTAFAMSASVHIAPAQAYVHILVQA